MGQNKADPAPIQITSNVPGSCQKNTEPRYKNIHIQSRLHTKMLFFLSDWEKKNGKTFLVGGVNFMEYIEAQKEEHLQQLEQEKLHREQVGQLHGVY